MYFWIGLGVGLVFGACVGFFAAAFFAISKEK